MTLNAIFNPLLSPYQLNVKTYLPAVNIVYAHFADLINAYNLGVATDLTKAQTLFCLSAVFARYSSSYLFGKESDSPQALRAYAAALLAKAFELDSSVFGNKISFTDCMQKLLGGRDMNGNAIFTCSAALSSEMLRHAQKRPDFNVIVAQIKPPAW
jgi:hypothetical protein